MSQIPRGYRFKPSIRIYDKYIAFVDTLRTFLLQEETSAIRQQRLELLIKRIQSKGKHNVNRITRRIGVGNAVQPIHWYGHSNPTGWYKRRRSEVFHTY